MINKFIALLIIIILSPIYLLISIMIYLTDGAPIFYVQKNYGIDHTTFDLYKFRTMKKNTPEMPTEEFMNADEYILKIGKFLRKYSLDEIPQFFNIIKGDLNFIGPRPCMTKNEDIIKNLREKKDIHKIKPGITGLAQVNGRDDNSYEKKVALDYEYMKNSNFLMDIQIIIKTIYVVLFPKNIKH